MNTRAIDVFTEAAEAAGTVVHRVATLFQVADLAMTLADGGAIIASPTLARRCKLATLGRPDIHIVDVGDPFVAADAAVGLGWGTHLVAETGSVLVDEHDLADRAVSMLALTLVQVAMADSIVATLDDAARILSSTAATSRYLALLTGPSLSADIERSLTVGVQGPATMHVAVLKSAS